MAKQTGELIKEARTAAGLSQKALAEKVDGLSASALGKAERGEKELTPQQIEAIAAALEVAPETLTAQAPEAPQEKAVTDEDLLELLKSADPETKNAAVSVLKGEKPQGGDMMSMFAGMMGGAGGEGGEGDSSEQAKAFFSNMMGGGVGGEGGDNPMAGMMGMLGGMMGGGAGGEGGDNPMAGMMGMLGGMMGGAGAGGENQENAGTGEQAPADEETKKEN